ncbi:flagellar protein FliT [Lysinibacillus parviboronicapiens]|uniref:flagellar protein FliT n=2 Tax=Lysinibacillus parviboronicapiens TaxID=436516 RepID=UPI001FD16154|nr:flagellar protein FliT [Lysinibacillus parviboronicapiens]
MMGPVEKLLSTSAQLYEHLTVIPEGDERDSYIEKIDGLLEKRGQLLEQVMASESVSLEGHQLTPHLIELDQGIQSRLKKVMTVIKTDMKNLQQSKKSEQTYLNPYGNVRVMDGMYYDGKK